MTVAIVIHGKHESPAGPLEMSDCNTRGVTGLEQVRRAVADRCAEGS